MLKMQPYQQSSQGSSEDSPSSNLIQVIHHVLNIFPTDRKWMEYMHYHNINELCDDPV